MRIPVIYNGSLLATPEFRKQEEPKLSGEVAPEYIGDGDEIPYVSLRNVLNEVMLQSEREKSDASGAALIHAALKLTRREAATNEFWHYLAVVRFADYVVWRWRTSEGEVPKERFVGGWERNALGRLWWLAELTHAESAVDPYEPTRLAASKQEFGLWTVDTYLAGNPVFIESMINESFRRRSLTDKQTRELFKSGGALGGSHILQFVPADRVAQLVARAADRIVSQSTGLGGGDADR